MILLDPEARPVIAHRGASADAPENTLEALHLAVAQGCDAFELDVQLTRDGVPVLLHDPTLARTAGRPERIRDVTLARLATVDAGVGAWAERGVRVPPLAEVLHAFPAMPMLIDLKTRQARHAVARVLREADAVRRVVIASFTRGALSLFREPPWLIGAGRRDILRLYLCARLGLRSPPPACAVIAPPDYWKGWLEVPIEGFVREARRHGRPVHVWTVDDPDRARELWRRGVNGIITNRPAAMRG